MYRVYYMNRFVASFGHRDEAVAHILKLMEAGSAFGDYEILDQSDWAN